MVAQVLREKRGLTLLEGGLKTPRAPMFRSHDRTVRRIQHRTSKVVCMPAVYHSHDSGSAS